MINIALTWLKRLLIIFFASTIGVVILYRWVNPPITFLMIQRFAEHNSNGRKARIDKDWEKLDKISPNLIYAVVASEDAKFMQHSGFDFESMKKVLKNNREGKRLKGASTISQQTAKNVFLWPSRTYIRKFLEAYFTLLIEIFWGKERIMEVYLNVIEMGIGVYGAEAASHYYYNKSAINLTSSEAAMIAAILPSPQKRDPKNPTPGLMKKRNWIMANMKFVENIKFASRK